MKFVGIPLEDFRAISRIVPLYFLDSPSVSEYDVCAVLRQSSCIVHNSQLFYLPVIYVYSYHFLDACLLFHFQSFPHKRSNETRNRGGKVEIFGVENGW